MGNWRTANVVGTCDRSEIRELEQAIQWRRDDRNQELHCLMGGGVCGLPNFAKPSFDVVGNLFERGYDEDSVKRALELLTKVAPSLECKVHLGGDYESKEVVFTITLEGGVATVGPPEQAEISEISETQMQQNLIQQLMRPRG